MSGFDSLTWAFEDWFDTPMQELPAPLRERAKREFVSMSWEGLLPDQRRNLALQLDYQHDPATKKDQEFWLAFFWRQTVLQEQLDKWAEIAVPTASDLAKKETRLIELQQELTRMNQLSKKKQSDYYPAKPATQGAAKVDVRYIAYPKAICRLIDRLGATPEELALWVWLGPDTGGLAAYVNANELDPPPRFVFSTGGDPDYVAALMPCWFEEMELSDFEPTDRYITGEALIDRWSDQLALKPEPFIKAKICESRLEDLHPVYGGTTGSFDEEIEWPPLSTGLFALSKVEAIEAEDFDGDGATANKSSKTKTKTSSPAPLPRNVLNGRVQPAEGTLPIRIAARKLETQKLHKTWQIAYRKSKKKFSDKSDVWHAIQISKLPIAEGRSADTIRKLMNPKK